MLIPIGNRLINTDHIISVTEHQGTGDNLHWTVALSNGESFATPYGLSDMCGTVVPAPPGLAMIEAFFPEPGDDAQAVTYATTTLVAFYVLGAVAPTPIGLQGEVTGGDLRAVIQPDGQCVAWDETWPDLAAFKAACEQRAAQAASERFVA